LAVPETEASHHETGTLDEPQVPRAPGRAANGGGWNGSSEAGSLAPNGHPCFRPDLEVMPESGTGSYIVRDPESGRAFELGEREFFLCGQLDGHTSPEDVLARFERRYASPMDPEAFRALVRQMLRQGILIAADAPALPQEILEAPGMVWHSPRWVDVDAVFTWLAESLRFCFTTPFAVFSAVLIGLGTGVIIRSWSSYWGEAMDLLKEGEFPILLTLGLVLFLSFFQSVTTGIACKLAGARVRSFDLKFHWHVFPFFRCDLSDVGLIWKKESRLRATYVGLIAQALVIAFATMAWSSTPPTAPLHTFYLMVGWVFITLYPWNPMVQRNGYFLLSEWLEVPNLMGRAKVATWAWFFGLEEREPLSRKERIGLRLYGSLWYLYVAGVAALIAILFVPIVVRHVDVTGFAMLLVVAAFGLEFPARKELMKFEPFSEWLYRNDGKSTVAWVTRLSLAGVVVLAMLVPYPYEPGGNLRILPSRMLGIRAQVAGQVAEVLVKEGDWVEKGQVVARLDAREQQKDLDVARANLESARAQLKLIEAGSKPEDIAKAREQMATADAALYYIRREAERLRKLYGEKVVSLALYERALKDRDVNQNVYETAKENLALVMSGARQEALDAQKAEIDRLETIMRNAEQDLALTVIRGPESGRVATPRPQERVGQ